MRFGPSIIPIFAALSLAAPAFAAELPAQVKKSKPPEGVRKCNVAGSPGVLAANGVCVKMSGYISAGFSAGQIK